MLKIKKGDLFWIGLVFFLIIFRFYLLPSFGIVDITVIVTSSMVHDKNWIIQRELSKSNIPWIFFVDKGVICNLPGKVGLARLEIPKNDSYFTVNVYYICDKELVDTLYKVAREIFIKKYNKTPEEVKANSSNYEMFEVEIYPGDLKNNKSVIFFELNLRRAAILPKYEDIPIKNGIQPGDVAIIMKVRNPCKDIKEGDVIQFYVPKVGENFVHRVIKKIWINNTCFFITKGDANPIPIPEIETRVKPENVRGKVTLIIPKLGILNYLFYKIILAPLYYQEKFKKAGLSIE